MDTYEKKYKEAQKWIESIYPNLSHEQQMEAEAFFPELKESEDERIRKFLIKWIQDNYYHSTTEIPTKTLIAWLEKQNSDVDNANKEYWRGYREGKQEILDKYAELEKQGEQKPADEVETITQSYITPNSEFFQWIYDRLIYVHHENPDVDYMHSLKERIEDMQKSAEWNEDSNSIISDLLDYFDEDKCLKHEVNDIVKWLKTIKPQQKEWGENEIKMLDNLITYLDGRKDLLEEIKSTYIDWPKSLKERCAWKPSIAQLNALSIVSKGNAPDDIEAIVSLYNDLKKLREE